MLNKKPTLALMSWVALTGMVLLPLRVFATEMAPLAPLNSATPLAEELTVPPMPLDAPPAVPTEVKKEEPLTVADVQIDVTAENSVVARNKAIVDARREAFRKLAERNMSPEDFKALTLPDDKVISSLVQDFEIKGEQMSANRYVASFTVRFRNGVTEYIDVALPDIPVMMSSPAVTKVSGGARSILVLPFYETLSGEAILWEDPNPWREAWQASPPAVPGWNIVVPLGDISDMATGPSEGVWSGDYTMVEKLRQRYGVNEVILTVANRSGVSMVIDIYSYKGGGLSEKKTLRPYISASLSDDVAFRRAEEEVIRILQAPTDQADTVESMSRELTGQEKLDQDFEKTLTSQPEPPPVVEQDVTIEWKKGDAPPPLEKSTSAATEVEASMDFTDFTKWMEAQKRISYIFPPVRVNIKSISKRNARFVMVYKGSFDELQEELTTHGLGITQVSAASDEPVADKAGASSGDLYDLRLLN